MVFNLRKKVAILSVLFLYCSSLNFATNLLFILVTYDFEFIIFGCNMYKFCIYKVCPKINETGVVKTLLKTIKVYQSQIPSK